MLAQSNSQTFLKENFLFYFILVLTFSYFLLFLFFSRKFNKEDLIQDDNIYDNVLSRSLQLSGGINKKFLDDYNNAKIVYDTVQTRTYKGVWNSSNKSQGLFDFDNNYGEIILSFEREQIALSINDGGYNDKRIKFGFLVNFNSHITKNEGNNYRLQYNSKIIVNHLEYLTEIKKESKRKINLDCYNEIVILFENLVSNKFFGNINGEVKSNCNGFQFEFSAILLDNPKDYTSKWKLRIFIFIVVVLGTLQLIISFQKLRVISFNLSLSKNYSLSFVCSNMIWNSFISTSCFLASLNFEEYSNTFCLAGLLFFVNFSIFEIKILLLIWKNNNNMLNDFILLRRKLMQFYAILYILILVFLCLSYYIILHCHFLLIIISFTFIPQIIHNTKTGNNPISLSNCTFISINKLFLPLYLRMCPKNFLGLEPNYVFSVVSISVIFFQVLLLFIQSVCGTRAIIPVCFRKKTFNYFKEFSEIKGEYESVENLTCCICLSLLIPSKENNYFENEKTGNLKKCNMFRCFKNIIKRKDDKPFMLTPCNHLFHTECLKPWHLYKEDCPMCRLPLPKIIV